MKNDVQCRRHPDGYLVNDQHTGDVVCATCGLVVDIVIDTSAEWREFDDDQLEKSRVGAAENVWLSAAGNLATKIAAPQQGPNHFGRIIEHHYKRRSVDRALSAGFDVISIIANRMNLPSAVIRQACDLYTKVFVKHAYKGNVLFRDPKTAACVYIATHMEQCARTSSEICGASEFARRDINRWASRIMRTLNITIGKARTVDFIPRFCGLLDVGTPVQRIAYGIARKMDDTGRMIQPECMAAAAISVADPDQRHTEEEICERLNVSTGLLLAYRTRIEYSISANK